MYKEHAQFISPVDTNTKIWRYMDLWKFESLLKKKALFFTRGDHFKDPLEGIWPEPNKNAQRTPPPNMSQVGLATFQQSIPFFEFMHKELRKKIAVNCWHVNSVESPKMWENYIETNEGIVIESNFNDFKHCMIDERTIYIGLVNYIDHKTYLDLPNHNLYAPFICKDDAQYFYEKELRAFVKNFSGGDDLQDSKFDIKTDIFIDTDIRTLIKNIYISPNSQPGFLDKVKALVKNHGYEFEVFSSQLL